MLLHCGCCLSCLVLLTSAIWCRYIYIFLSWTRSIPRRAVQIWRRLVMCLQVCELLSLSSAGRVSTSRWLDVGSLSSGQHSASVRARFSLPRAPPSLPPGFPYPIFQTSIKLYYANIRSKVATKAHLKTKHWKRHPRWWIWGLIVGAWDFRAVCQTSKSSCYSFQYPISRRCCQLHY